MHTEPLIHLVENVSLAALQGENPVVMLTPDTYANEHTNLCARLAAGSAAEVACMVATGRVPHGAAIVRPPGACRVFCVEFSTLLSLFQRGVNKRCVFLRLQGTMLRAGWPWASASSTMLQLLHGPPRQPGRGA